MHQTLQYKLNELRLMMIVQMYCISFYVLLILLQNNMKVNACRLDIALVKNGPVWACNSELQWGV